MNLNFFRSTILIHGCNNSLEKPWKCTNKKIYLRKSKRIFKNKYNDETKSTYRLRLPELSYLKIDVKQLEILAKTAGEKIKKAAILYSWIKIHAFLYYNEL